MKAKSKPGRTNAKAGIGNLFLRLAKGDAALQAVEAGQVDAVIDPTTGDAVLLHAAQKALRESEERFAGIVNSAMDAIITVDAAQRIVFFNAAAEKMFGYRAAEVMGWPLTRIIPPRFGGSYHAYIRKFGDTGFVSRRKGQLRPISGLRANGEEFPLEASISGLTIGGQRFYSVILRDVTDARRAQDELLAANERLRFLSHRVFEIQEAERQNVARELHDGLGQDLAALKLQLHMTEPLVGASGKWRVKECIATAEHAIEQVRELSLSLRPEQLDDLGLVAALRWNYQKLTRIAGLKLRVATAKTLPPVPHPIEIACYRIAQEALTNIVKHAGAKHVWLNLSENGGELKLRVRDDGNGFDIDAARARAVTGRNFGLISMQERVELAGGRMALDSEPGKGTEIVAVFPLTPPTPVHRRADDPPGPSP